VREGVIELGDGRRLGYGEWGPAGAPVVFYCHGFPGNHHELDLAVPVMERSKLAVRVIALDRPGYGISTFQPGRALLDWPDNVAGAADCLGIEEFAVLGVSGGGPYALACGYALGERVTRLGIVCGTAPMEAPGMEESALVTTSSSWRLMRHVQYGLAAMQMKRGGEERVIQRAVSTMGPADREAMRRPEVRDWFVRVTREAFRQGGRAAAHESHLYRESWGFGLGAVRQNTSLWYGGADHWVPVKAGRWVAEQIPHARFEMWPQHGHFTWAYSYEAAGVVVETAGLS
jgi:pimeloyl-ACP methyl ester carboxylesterase